MQRNWRMTVYDLQLNGGLSFLEIGTGFSTYLMVTYP